MTLALEDRERADVGAVLLETNGANVERAGSELRVSGDLARILSGCLEDSTDLFRNDDVRIEAKYGHDGKDVLFGWWMTGIDP